MYPLDLVAPMSRELTENGFESLRTSSEVDDVLGDKKGTVLVVVNSVCGCAASNARPGAVFSVRDRDVKPDRMVTVFAGVDKDATSRAREYMMPYPASSPSMGLFKDGKLVHFLERHHIEGAPADLIAENLQMAFDRYC